MPPVAPAEGHPLVSNTTTGYPGWLLVTTWRGGQYGPAYLTENADGIRRDWPRIPLPGTETP